MRVLICGGRDYTNYKAFSNWMSQWVARTPKCIPMVIIEGGAKGVDSMAKEWGLSRSQQVIEFPAQWDKYGKRAGYIRNLEMLENGYPDCVIAFPGGKGTEMMIKLAMSRDITVYIPTQKELERYT